jgi:uncharacterized phiE125 gp8 family phage protein
MRRSITTPPVLTAALAELKDWLAITTPRENAALELLLRAALETCEAFTGLMPLAAPCEEVLPANPSTSSGWQTLMTRPVQAIAGIEGIADDGARFVFEPSAYTLDLVADGAGLVRLRQQGPVDRIAVRFTAGLAAEWGDLPDGLRHGVIRLAAHHYRQREADTVSPNPPAAVAALWRPWRQLRLA